MNKETGIFTAPKKGTYYFSFAGLTDADPNLSVGLFVNGVRLTSGFGAAKDDMILMKATVRLNIGDTVSIRNWGVSSGLYDSSSSYTVFTGWLMEEELF